VLKAFEPGGLLSFKDYRRLFISSTLVNLGASAFPIALAVAVLENGGGATELGLILGSRVLASSLFVLVGGVWADRIRRKFVMIGADVFRGGLAAILVFATLPSVPHWIMALIVFLRGIGDAFGAPASSSIMPSILPTEKLGAGNVLRNVTARMAQIVGPGIGGLAVATIGARPTFLIVTFFFIIGTIILLPINEPKPVKSADKPPAFIVELREGLRIVWSMPWVAASIAMASVQLMVVMGTENVLLPVITRREFHTNSVFALATAAFSIGGSISAFLALRFKAKQPGLVSVGVWGAFAIAPLALAFPISPTFVVISYLIAGVSIGPWDAYWSVAIQREVPQKYQGRVFSVDHMGSVGLMPIGMALAGPLTDLFGERPFLITAVVFHVLICILVLRVPGVKELKTPVSK
jgi:MFS family permease